MRLGRMWGLLVAAIALALPLGATAQTPPKPPVDDSPRFEIRRFVFEGAKLVPAQQLEAETQPFVGPQKTFADVQRALEVVGKELLGPQAVHRHPLTTRARRAGPAGAWRARRVRG